MITCLQPLAYTKKMASGSVGTVLPLWRIHNFSSHGAGGTVRIINIARPDTIALLSKLSGDYGPMWATGKLALAVNYTAETSTLDEATLVRIKNVSASPQPGVYNAELLVLCQARVCDVSTGGPYPTAKHAPDLAPLWRIHRLGLVGDPAFDMKRTEFKIQNIAREDTLAMLKKLGGGEVESATGHMVLACDYTAKMVAGLRAVLVRIGDITCGEEGGPPYNCTLKCLGHVRCASVEAVGAFPQVLLDEIPVWRIHNLNTGSSGPQHRITNIARPDTVALLTYLGQGNPLSSAGGLVIGCDYTAPPAVGGSGRLMKVASINQAAGREGKYEALLVDVSSVTVGKFCSNAGLPEDWWPRLTVILPKVWNKPEKPSAPLPRAPTAAVKCAYWLRCQKALMSLLRDAGIQLQHYIDHKGSLCLCHNCHSQGDGHVFQRGGQKYVMPVGFARVGVFSYKPHDIKERGMKEWHVCFHGTKHEYLGNIVLQGQLLLPGSILYNGESIKVRDGHIKKNFERTNEHTGRRENFNPTYKVFFSPSVKYCIHEVYTNIFYCDGKLYRFALQLRIQPNTYEIGQQTIGAKGQIDPHIPNSSIEWYSDQPQAHFFTGILIREE